MITPAVILRLSPTHTAPKTTADKLQMACEKFGITSPRSQAALLANCMVESNVTPKRENLYYTTAQRLRDVFPSKFGARGVYDPSTYVRSPQALANLVYAYRLGNGPPISGDGWNFRGGTFLQLTGRSNYHAASNLIGYDLTATPDLIDQIGISALVSAAYWARMSRANHLAEQGDIRGTRSAVNGPAMLDVQRMLGYYQQILPLLS